MSILFNALILLIVGGKNSSLLIRYMLTNLSQ